LRQADTPVRNPHVHRVCHAEPPAGERGGV
jgi:hypothetical protein